MNVKGTSIAHLNVRGLQKNVEELKVLTSKYNCKFFCVSETFLNSHNPNTPLKIANYTLPRRDRVAKHGYAYTSGMVSYTNR